jgi:16S rRNA (guanine527-N7)-methyltransferase
MHPDLATAVQRALSLRGRPLDESQRALLARYVDRLVAATATLNLTAVRDIPGVYRRHIAESLALLRLLEEQGVLPTGARVIDIGSGGGLPGIPMAIARPDLHVTLLEAAGKKAAFLRDTVAALELPRVDVLAARAEEAGRDSTHRERYDVAVARAVAPLNVLAELALPLVRPGGWLAAVKGSRVHDELAEAQGAIERCGGRAGPVLPLPTMVGAPLSVVLIRKERPTPPELPRRPGMPAKRPLR